MKLRYKAKSYSEEQNVFRENHQTIPAFEKGYMTALQDFREAIKANPKLTAKQILEHLEKEI